MVVSAQNYRVKVHVAGLCGAEWMNSGHLIVALKTADHTLE